MSITTSTLMYAPNCQRLSAALSVFALVAIILNICEAVSSSHLVIRQMQKKRCLCSTAGGMLAALLLVTLLSWVLDGEPPVVVSFPLVIFDLVKCY